MKKKMRNKKLLPGILSNNSRNKKVKSSIAKNTTSVLIASICLLSQNSHSEEPSISISIASDSVSHGISLSNDKPTIGLSYDQNLGDSFFVGAEINTHQTSGPNNRQGRRHIYGGFFTSIKNETALSLSVNRYIYDADFPISWDYNQLRLDLSLPFFFGISYSYSDSYYGRGDNSQRVEFSWSHHFNEQYTLTTATGLTKPERHVYLEDFIDANVSVTRHFERSRLNFGYHYVDDTAEIIHGPQNIEPRFTLTYEWDLY